MSARSRRDGGPVLPFAKAFQRSISPSPTRATSFDTSPFPYRSTSPTRVNLHGFTSSVRLSSHRPISATSSQISNIHKNNNNTFVKKQSRTCMCSPTTHPGSFRCSLHKNNNNNNNNNSSTNYLPNRLNARRSAMANSLVRIGTVEGDLVRRALAQLIRPSSHQQKRRGVFQPRPSRLSVMSKSDD